MNGNTRYRLDAALDVIKAVYNYVDAGLMAEDPGIMKQAYEELVAAGWSGRQAKRFVAAQAFAGVTSRDDGYDFCEQRALENLAVMPSVSMMN